MRSFFLIVNIFLSFHLFGQEAEINAGQSQIDTLLTKAKNSPDLAIDEAIALVSQAEQLSIDHFGKEHSSYAECQIAYGDVHAQRNDFNQAETYYLQACEHISNHQGKKSELYLKALTQLNGINWKLSKYKEALVIHDEQIELATYLYGREHRITGRHIRSKAGMLATMGKYQEAMPLFIESTEIMEKVAGRESVEYAKALRNLALLYMTLDDFKLAEEQYKEVKAIREKMLGKDHPDYGETLYDLGTLYSRIGNRDVAEEYYLEALQIFEKAYGKNHNRYVYTLLELGSLYGAEKKYEKAEPYFIEAAEILEDLYGKTDANLAIAVNYLAIIYMHTGRYEKAEEYFKESLRMREEIYGKDSYSLVYTQFELAQLYQRTGKEMEAESLFKKAEALIQNTYGLVHDRSLYITNLLAKFYFDFGKVEEAAAYFEEASNITKTLCERGSTHLNDDEMQGYISLVNEGSDLFHSYTHHYSTASTIEKSFDNNLFYKGYLLNKTLRTNQLIKDAPDELKEKHQYLKEKSEQLAKGYALPLKERSNITDLEKEVKDLEKEMIKELSGLETIQQQFTWKELQEELKSDELVIEFVNYILTEPGDTSIGVTNEFDTSKDIYYSALILKKDLDSPLFVPLFSEKEIGNLRAIPRLYALNGSLQANIWNKLADYTKGINSIYYAPSGILNRINIGAIPINEEDVVADQFQLFRMGSSRQLLLPNNDDSNDVVDAIVFGGVDYGEGNENSEIEQESEEMITAEISTSVLRAYKGGDWDHLEWTGKEADEVEKVLLNNKARVSSYTGKDANEQAFKSLGQGSVSPKIIHVATHGFFFPDKRRRRDGEPKNSFENAIDPMMRSGLILANGNKTWQGEIPEEGEEDGVLTALEIANMDLSNTEIVVLSACETGLGDIQGDEGVFGLQRAFKVAGAKYILMSLWKVNDVETYEFMTTFYKEWMETGKSIPEAYKSAQSIMRAKQPGNVRSWAGFVLVE